MSLKKSNIDKQLLTKYAAWSIRIAKILALIYGITFSWLKLRGVNYSLILNELKPDDILKISLIIFYSSWLYGVIIDARSQEKIYQVSEITRKQISIGVIVIIPQSILYFILCLITNNLRLFLILLTISWLYNYIFYIVFVKYIAKPTDSKNEQLYLKEGDFYLLERYKIGHNFLYGSWYIKRYLIGFIILLFANLAYNLPFMNFLPSNEKNVLCALIASFFILFSEIWIWMERMKRAIMLDYIQIIDKRYRIKQIKNDKDDN